MLVDDEVFNCHAIMGLMNIIGLKNLNEIVRTAYSGEDSVKLI